LSLAEGDATRGQLGIQGPLIRLSGSN
jgi:hypothetical protein